MGKRARLAAVITVVTAVAWIPPTAGAQDADFTVLAGAVHPDVPERPYEYTRYYPEDLQVHRGQVVAWRFLGNPTILGAFHTVTFSADGRPPFLRPDEVPDTYAFPERWDSPTGCGRGTQPVCVLDEETTFLSSGTPIWASGEFHVQVDVPAGTYDYFCTVHPAMTGSIEVVDDAVALPTQAQIDADAAQQVFDDSVAADALFTADDSPRPCTGGVEPGCFTLEQGQRVWNVLTGIATIDHHVSINAYLPGDLAIAPGDRVRYSSLDYVINEIHTVTFPGEAALSGAQAFTFLCDLDDPETGLVGIPGPWIVNPAACPGTPEVGTHYWMTTPIRAPEDEVLTRATYHNSAMIVPPGAPDSFRLLPDTGQPLLSQFDAVFPLPGEFAFGCHIHEAGMAGTVRAA